MFLIWGGWMTAGALRKADHYFDVMAHHINVTLHQIYGVNMTQPYSPWLQDAGFQVSLNNLNRANVSWKAHYRRRENLFIA